MQNKKNKKQNGGEGEGKIIFTYVLLTFLVGFILYCIHWCFVAGNNHCDQFFEDLDKGDWRGAWSNFLEPDGGVFEQGINEVSRVVRKAVK